MRQTIVVIALLVLNFSSAFAQDRPTKPTKGWMLCSQWCAKCKPDPACTSTCQNTGNRYVHDSCSVRGGG